MLDFGLKDRLGKYKIIFSVNTVQRTLVNGCYIDGISKMTAISRLRSRRQTVFCHFDRSVAKCRNLNEFASFCA